MQNMGSILVLIVMLCACVSLSSACACVPDDSPKRFCHYDLIFRGTVETEYKEQKTDPENPYPELDFDSNYVYSVRVELPVKMPENLQGKDTITIRTKTQGRFCGTRFNVDEDELIFARIDDEGNVTTGTCDPNTPWANMTDSFRELITEDLMDICSNPEPFLYQTGNA